MKSDIFDCFTVTLNPAIDQTLQIPLFAAGRVNRVVEEESRPGGKGINVAMALADAGFCVAAGGLLGKQNAGLFEHVFQEKGIADFCVRIAGATRTGIKIVDPNTQQTTDINFPGITPRESDLAKLQETLTLVQARWAVLAGSLPPGVDATFYAKLATALRQQGMKVAVDTSGESLAEALKAKPAVIKPNVHELSELVDHPLPNQESVLRTVRELNRDGIETVIVSMGAAGALFVKATEAVFVTPPQIPIRTTVGAGDAMVAGYVAASLQSLGLADAARLATAFSLRAIAKDPPASPDVFLSSLTTHQL